MTPDIPHTGDTGADGQCLGLTRLPLRVQCSQLTFACSLRVTSIPVCIRRFRSSIESSAPPKGLHVQANDLEFRRLIRVSQDREVYVMPIKTAETTNTIPLTLMRVRARVNRFLFSQVGSQFA